MQPLGTPYSLGNGNRNSTLNCALAKQRASGGSLGNVVGGELGQPGLGRGKSRNQVGTAEGQDHGGLSRSEHLVYEEPLIFRETDVTLAVSDTDKKRDDQNVISIRRWQLQAVDVHELRVGPKRS